MKGLIQFYRAFYGLSFHRHFRRPPDFNSKERKFRVQYSVETPKNLWLHVHRNSGYYPCLASVYDHGSKGNLKQRNLDGIVFDRAFFDFDVHQSQAYQIKRELQELRCHGLNYETELQFELREMLQDLVIYEKIAELAVKEAKDFSKRVQQSFGRETLLLFSGCKGCHAYTFFDPTSSININRALKYFAEKAKWGYQYKTLDLSVVRDAMSRLSRIPYSKHQLSGLTVVPFTSDDGYEDIVEKSLHPKVDQFQITDYFSNMGSHLEQLDHILEYNQRFMESEKEATCRPIGTSKGRVTDHREWFKNLLGQPAGIYPDKDYVMYRCPFPDHEDNKPSFRVHKMGYYCYGCQRRGNYFQFLKDYNGWDDEKVKNYLKIRKNRPPPPNF